jgi:hypothetical protein
MPPNPCDSLVCKAQIQAAYVKIKEINHVVRTLAVDIENARAQAQRHEHHVKYLTKCMSEVGGQRLDDDALRKLMFDAGGEYPVFKVPENLSIISSEHSIDRSLAEESLSSDGMEMDRI